MEKINQINNVIKAYFEKYKSLSEIPAKDLMPEFLKAKVFAEDKKNGLPIRTILRKLDKSNDLHLIPFVYADRKATNVNWFFRRNNSASFSRPKEVVQKVETPKSIKKFKDSDENYVLNLCDELLHLKGSRQHRFDFLVGDSGVKLPVDIYYEKLNLVIEYREYQHTNELKFFDKPDVMTVSGVSRGEQRKLYDQRRRDILPQQKIKLIEINFTDFTHSKNKIVRNKERDLEVLKKLVAKIIK